MPGKSLTAFSENWIVWALLLGAYAVVGAVSLWVAGHLSLWWPMTSGMVLVVGLGAAFYVGLIVIEKALRLSVENRPGLYILVNLFCSWGLSIAWGWILGSWAGSVDRSDPDLFDAVLVYASAVVCFWFSSSSVGLLFNGTIYVWGSMFAGFVALILSAILS